MMAASHLLQTKAARLKGNSNTGPETAGERKLTSGGPYQKLSNGGR